MPVASIPDFRRDSLMELLECGELLRCSSERGTACVSPVLLLDAVRQLPAPLSARLLAGDPVSSIWPGWAANAPAPRPLTEVASDVLAHAGGARDRISLVAKLQVIADDLGLSAIAAMARGAGATARLTGSSPALPALEPRVRPTVSS